MYICVSANADYQNVSKSARAATVIKVLHASELFTAHTCSLMRKSSGLTCPFKNMELHISYRAYSFLFELLTTIRMIGSEVK